MPLLILTRVLPLLAAAALAAAADAPPDFAKDIQPLLEKRCVECHGAKKAKGKLRLDSADAIQKGGKGGAAVVPGKPDKSPLYTRTILPQGDDDVMPAKGDALTKEQTELLRAWIAAGAPFTAGAAKPGAAKPADAKPGAPANDAKDKDANDGKDAKDPKKADGSSSREPTGPTDLDRLADGLGKPDAGAVAALTKRGARVSAISANGALLDIDCSHAAFADEDASALKTIGAHVAWLDLGHTDATPNQLACIAAMPNLVRLHLEYTKASDATLRHCEKCPRLAYVNVVGTEVGDDGLSRLVGLKDLEAVYVAGSKVTDAGVTMLKTAAPQADVEGEMPADVVAASDQPAATKKRRKKKQ